MPHRAYPPELAIEPLTTPVDREVHVPGSKSITNRALVLAALTPRDGACTLRGVLRSEDTEVMVNCLKTLGFTLETHWDAPEPYVVFPPGEHRRIPATEAELFVANSGTTMRFLTAFVATGHGRFRLDGIPRMRERPIQDLLDALNQLEGVKATSETGNGCPPVVIETHGLRGGHVKMRAGLSSQFLSGLLMAAPFADDDVTIELLGPIVSTPYIEMSVMMMQQWGYRVAYQGRKFHISARSEPDASREYAIEPDASAASYFFAAAAILGGRVTVAGMHRDMLQGDVKFVDLLEQMGCQVEEGPGGITVHGRPLRGITADMNAISDTVMTMAAVACFADGPTVIRNVGHIRHKETDRLTAVATELRKFGVEVEEHLDGMKITPRPMQGSAVDTYNDHRMAMSLALVGLKVPGVVVRNPGCVAKTYPKFWQDLEKLRSS